MRKYSRHRYPEAAAKKLRSQEASIYTTIYVDKLMRVIPYNGAYNGIAFGIVSQFNAHLNVTV